jgi:thiol-disulfide isomerase/thioredoxin
MEKSIVKIVSKKLIKISKREVHRMYVCSECGSDQVRKAYMLDYNTKEVVRMMMSIEESWAEWCDDCDAETNAVKDIPNDCEKRGEIK